MYLKGENYVEGMRLGLYTSFLPLLFCSSDRVDMAGLKGRDKFNSVYPDYYCCIAWVNVHYQ